MGLVTTSGTPPSSLWQYSLLASRSRHVFLRRSLPPGRYIILPTTFSPGQEGNFLLRLFSSGVSSISPLLLHSPPTPCLLSCGLVSLPSLVTRVTIAGAVGLEKQDLVGSRSSPACYLFQVQLCLPVFPYVLTICSTEFCPPAADPYVTVMCEGQSWSSVPVQNCLQPDWAFSVICFRKRPEKPIKIQVRGLTNRGRKVVTGRPGVEPQPDGGPVYGPVPGQHWREWRRGQSFWRGGRDVSLAILQNTKSDHTTSLAHT